MRIEGLRRIPLFLALITLFSPLALRGQRTGSIIGQVQLPGGEHLAQRVLVSLQMRNATITSAYTTIEGRFSFSQLIPNVYDIVVNVEGYYPVRESARVQPDVIPTTMVRIILRRIETPDREPTPERIAGGNPHAVDVSDYVEDLPPKAVKEFEAGVEADEKGEHDKALRHYKKALELAPNFYQAHNNLGSKYLSKGEFEAAEKEFEKAIDLSPADANAYFNLGNCLFLTQRFEEAERRLRQGLERDFRSAFGHHLLGAVLMHQGRYAESEDSLRRAIALDPSMPEVYLELANLYLIWQRNVEAKRELTRFVELFPDHPLRPKIEELLDTLENAAPPSQNR